MTFIERLAALDKLVVERASIGTVRNLISSLREQAEADAKRTAELIAANQKVVAEKTALAQEISKLKAQQPNTPPKIKMNLGIGKLRNPI